MTRSTHPTNGILNAFVTWVALAAVSCLVPLRIRAAQENAGIQLGGTPVQMTISEVSERTMRIELSPLDREQHAGQLLPSPMLVAFPSKARLTIRELAKPTEVRVGGLRVSLKTQPLTITVSRRDGSLIQELVFGDEETNSISFRTAASVLGLGEGGDQFDRRGYNFPLINGQRYKLAELGTRIFSPFIIGTEGWALFVSAPYGSVDLRGERGMFHPERNSTPGSADVFVIDARNPADAMREFIRITGAPVMPPKWALGYMQSHRTLSTEADILAEARTFREKNLPVDTFIFLGTGFCPAGWNFSHDSFSFNTNVFVRSPAEVIRDLHALNIHIALHVVPQDPRSRDARSLYPSLHGSIPPAPGEVLDALHIQTYWKRHSELFAAGVDGWWPDEGDWFDVPSRLARHRMYYEGSLSERPRVRPWNLQRNGAPGIARYGGWVWSGDIGSNWRTLAAQVKVGQNSSLSVSPFWGTDIGGFYPSTNREFTGELYARWFEFAAFTPSFRSHGRNWWLHRPWGWDTGEVGPIESRPVPNESELHNAAVEPICRQYLNLRYALMPYTYTITRESHDTGLPLMRSLWLHYPKDAEAAKLGDEFLWGRDLLIAPVTEKAATSRRVYLPAGEWFDWWTDKKVSGAQWTERAVDLATMPIYVRAGAIIPIDPVRQYVSQPVGGLTTLKIYPGADGEFTLYDDDGQSLGYLNSFDPNAIWIRFRWDDSKKRLTMEPDSRMKAPGFRATFNVEIAGNGAKAKPVTFSGKRISVDL